ncbi:MAG TPA: glycosyltransferase [Terracidiphilus sp.]|jgi:glycosyltransferase involved in cell wall biosynthesis
MNKQAIILLVIPHLGGGGAERVVALLAAGLNPNRFQVHLGLVTQTDAAGFALPPNVTVHGIGARRVRSGWWKLLRLVRNLKPDVILSGMTHLNLLLLLLRPLFPRKTRVLVRQNGCVLAGESLSAYRKLYSRADAIVCQSSAMASDLARLVSMKPKLRVLPNPVDLLAIRNLTRSAPPLWTGPGPHLLAVGRLAPEKGFDLLLQAFARVRNRFPSADLTIVGEGREKAALEMTAGLVGVRTAVRFTGHVDLPAAWFPGATAFVLSSRHEALPNALLEAAAAGLPLVATPASQGVVDLLRGQPGVWIAPAISVDAIAAALEAALDTVKLESRFAHDWVNAFSHDRAIAAYESFLDEWIAEPVL